MIIIVLPEGMPPDLARSSATRRAAISASLAVAVSADCFSSPDMMLMASVESMRGALRLDAGMNFSRSLSETASVRIEPPRPSAASNSTFTSGPPAPS